MSWRPKKSAQHKRKDHHLPAPRNILQHLQQQRQQNPMLLQLVGGVLVIGFVLWLSLSLITGFHWLFELTSLGLLAWGAYRLRHLWWPPSESPQATPKTDAKTSDTSSESKKDEEPPETASISQRLALDLDADLDTHMQLPTLTLPQLDVSDLLQPGQREALRRLASAKREDDYAHALQQLDLLQKNTTDEDPAWLLARASAKLQMGDLEAGAAALIQLQTRHPESRHAQDAMILELATLLEFGEAFETTLKAQRKAQQPLSPTPKEITPQKEPAASLRLAKEQNQGDDDAEDDDAEKWDDIEEEKKAKEKETLLETKHAFSTTPHHRTPYNQAKSGKTLVETRQVFSTTPKALPSNDAEATAETTPPSPSHPMQEANTAPLPAKEPPPPLEQMEPRLGGLLLSLVSQLEALLDQADRLREAGEYSEAHAILEEIIDLAPDSRYAKDAQLRLLGDQLFQQIEHSSSKTP